MRADRFAACYVALWAAHDVADHVAQTDEQAAGKADPRPGYWEGAMLGHLAGYGLAQAVALGALRAAGVPLRPGRVLAALALSVVSHGVLDRRWPVVKLLERTGSPRFADPRVEVEPLDHCEHRVTSIRAAFGPGCATCDGTGHVCSDDGTGPGWGNVPPGHHGDVLHPWDGLSARADACDHGGGAPCPRCSATSLTCNACAARSTGPLPLHGPYLADQALHHVCVAFAAAIASGGPR